MRPEFILLASLGSEANAEVRESLAGARDSAPPAVRVKIDSVLDGRMTLRALTADADFNAFAAPRVQSMIDQLDSMSRAVRAVPDEDEDELPPLRGSGRTG